MDTLDHYRKNAESLTEAKPQFTQVINPFFHILQFVVEEPFRGACHATSGILYVLLHETGINAVINMGELGRDKACFDHSWIEVEGDIFDISIARTLHSEFDSPPIFANRSLDSMAEPTWKYVTSSGIGDDPVVKLIKAGSFTEFMDNAPFHKNGLWYFVQKFGKRCGLKINLNKVRQKYSQVQWRLR